MNRLSANIVGPCNHFFHLFKMGGNDLKIVSLIYFMVSAINILTIFRLTICFTFIKKKTVQVLGKCMCFRLRCNGNNLQDIMPIAYFLIASKNIDYDHVYHMICTLSTGYFLIRARDCDI